MAKNWMVGAIGALAIAGMVACTADRSGTISGGPLLAVSINVDGCVPTAGATAVTWSGAAEAVASVQVRYAQGNTSALSAWVNLTKSTKAGSATVAVPADAAAGTWNVDKVVLATRKNGQGVLSERQFDCVTVVPDTTQPTVEPTYVIQTIPKEPTVTIK